MKIPHDDPRLCWAGSISLERTPTFTRPWRIPFEQRSLFPPALMTPARTQAGVRLAFRSNTDRVAGRILPLDENQKLDLFIDGQQAGTADLAGQAGFTFEGLGRGEKLVELWLPQRGDFALEELEIGSGATLAAYHEQRPRWITYGSSITHCREAASPSRTWPSLVARKKGLNLTCLGFGGQCHLDVQMARLMRDLPADYLSICAGINIYGAPSLNERTFPAALIGFVQILREKHPETPLLVISPIFSAPREETPNSQGWTLARYRSAVEGCVQIMKEAGDRNISYLSGLQLFDASLQDLMPDKLHPNAAGYEAMARNFLERAAPLLFTGLGASGAKDHQA